MRTLVLIQARLGGSRFPGKIAERLGPCSVLEHVVRRARHKGYTVLIAAPATATEDWRWSQEWRSAVPDNRGAPGYVPVYMPAVEEEDVLGRMAAAARWANDMSRFVHGQEGYGCIVRLTADCPFVPVEAINAVAEAITSGEHDYSETRSDPSSRPNGIDAQAFTLDVLLRADRACRLPGGREHLTVALLEAAQRPGRVSQLEGLRLDDVPGFRITVDTPEDMERYRVMAEHVSVDPTAGRPTLVVLKDLHRRMPELFMTEGA